ncbi:MAG: hypothetical protein LBD23_08400, partial [Oscillospiraceae bacterium]|nr:hypothetical protein [Oscillospiraceae bacterium]
MAKLLTGSTIVKLVEDGNVIMDGRVENCDAVKYDFVLGDRFLKAKYGTPVSYDDLKPIEKSEATVEPGEVVYVLTKETINLPNNMFIQLSHKRKMTEYGILTLGGHIVDPNYNGKLMFGLYNFSSKPFKLIPGRSVAGASIFELEENEVAEINVNIKPEEINDFSSRLIERIQEFSPIVLSSLEEVVKAIKIQVEKIEKEMSKNKEDLDEIKRHVKKAREDIDENNEQISKISKVIEQVSVNLDKEIGLRNSMKEELECGIKRELAIATDKIDKELTPVANKLNQRFIFLKGAL